VARPERLLFSCPSSQNSPSQMPDRPEYGIRIAYNCGIHMPHRFCNKQDGNAGQGTLMAKKAKHSKAEITTKLAQAADLATQGKLQSEIARTLGVSVMTLHRWRKMSPSPRAAVNGPDQLVQVPQASRIAELQLENSRLRRLVTDLLLEKLKLEEAFQAAKPSAHRASS
jgi:putative transposase